MTDLTEISGVGPAYAEELREAGYETAEDVAVADADELDDSIESINGLETVSKAKKLVDVDTRSSVSEERYAVDDLSNEQRYHAISALIDREINARQSNQAGDVEIVQEAISILTNDEGPYEFTLDQLTHLYTGINQHEAELRSLRGISGFVSDIKEMKEQVQQLRSENWPDE